MKTDEWWENSDKGKHVMYENKVRVHENETNKHIPMKLNKCKNPKHKSFSQK